MLVGHHPKAFERQPSGTQSTLFAQLGSSQRSGPNLNRILTLGCWRTELENSRTRQFSRSRSLKGPKMTPNLRRIAKLKLSLNQGMKSVQPSSSWRPRALNTNSLIARRTPIARCAKRPRCSRRTPGSEGGPQQSWRRSSGIT